MNIFHATYVFGNEIVDHVAWKRRCAITKKYVFEFRVISTIHYGLSNDYRWKFSFIHLLLRLMMSFSFSSKTFRHSGSALFGEMCRSTSKLWTQISRRRARFQKRSDHCEKVIGSLISRQLTISRSERIRRTILLRSDHDPGRSCSLRGSVLDQKFHHNNWSFYQ